MLKELPAGRLAY